MSSFGDKANSLASQAAAAQAKQGASDPTKRSSVTPYMYGSDGTYYYDFSQSDEYKAALEKYKNHPLYQNLVSMAGLKGVYSYGFWDRLKNSLGMGSNKHVNFYNDAYQNFTASLNNIIQQLEATTYNSEEETAKRQEAAGLNTVLNGLQAGFGVTDEEQPTGAPSAMDAMSDSGFQGIADALSFFPKMMQGLSSTVMQVMTFAQDMRSKKIDNAVKAANITKEGREIAFNNILDSLGVNFEEDDALDKALGLKKEYDENGNEIQSNYDILSKAIDSIDRDYGDPLLNKAIGRYSGYFRSDNLRVRQAAAERLKRFYEDRYGAAEVKSRPPYDDDFGTMVDGIADIVNKHFEEIQELAFQLQNNQVALQGQQIKSGELDLKRKRMENSDEMLESDKEARKATNSAATISGKMEDATNGMWVEIDEYLKAENSTGAKIMRLVLPYFRSLTGGFLASLASKI